MMKEDQILKIYMKTLLYEYHKGMSAMGTLSKEKLFDKAHKLKLIKEENISRKIQKS